jgi:hypothetical protein
MKFLTLPNAEAMLLVDNDKAQIRIFEILRKEGMGPDNELYLATTGRSGQLPPLFGRYRS